MKLITLEKVYKQFPVKRSLFGKVLECISALSDVSLSVGKGETVGVIGESGCGKSTLGKVILDIEKPDRGRVLYKGKEISELKRKEYKDYRINVQAVFQNPQSSLNPRWQVWKLVTEGLSINFRYSKAELKEKAEELLRIVGLPPSFSEKYPHQLSGGQKQRVAVARAIALKPELIVADEPTSALDVSVQAQIVNLMVELQEVLGISYLFISHSLPVVESISDRVIVMYKGFIVEEGTSREVFSETAHPYTELLISSTPLSGRKVSQFPYLGEGHAVFSRCPFYPRCTRRVPECRSYRMQVLQLSETHKVRCVNPIPSGQR
ncbi:MAG: oligopeptide/dipeptide ABC transporter ATP-binding protein [Desulfurobacteriaceae bacterium]